MRSLPEVVASLVCGLLMLGFMGWVAIEVLRLIFRGIKALFIALGDAPDADVVEEPIKKTQPHGLFESPEGGRSLPPPAPPTVRMPPPPPVNPLPPIPPLVAVPLARVVTPSTPHVPPVPKDIPKPASTSKPTKSLRLEDLLPQAKPEVATPSAEEIELMDWINLREAGIGLLAATLRLCAVDENVKFDKVYAWVLSLAPSNVQCPRNEEACKRLRECFFSQYKRPLSPYVLIMLLADSSDRRFKQDLASLALMLSVGEDVDSVVTTIYGKICSRFGIPLTADPARDVPMPSSSEIKTPYASADPDFAIASIPAAARADSAKLIVARVRLLSLLSTPAIQVCRIMGARPPSVVVPVLPQPASPSPAPASLPVPAPVSVTPIVPPVQAKVAPRFELKTVPIVEDAIVKGVEIYAIGTVDPVGPGPKEFTYWLWDVSPGKEVICMKSMPDIDDIVDPAVHTMLWPDATYDPFEWNRVAAVYFNQSLPPFGGNRLMVAAGRLTPSAYANSSGIPVSLRSPSVPVVVGSSGYVKLKEIRDRQIEEEFAPLRRVFALAVGLATLMGANTTHAQDKVLRRLAADLTNRCTFGANLSRSKDEFDKMSGVLKKRRLTYWVSQVDGMTPGLDYQLKMLLVKALGDLIDGRKIKSDEAIALYNHCLDSFGMGHLPRRG